MDMSTIPPEVWAGLAAFLLGIAIIAGTFSRKVGWKINPVLGAVIGAGLIVFGGAFSIPQLLPEVEETGSGNVNVNVDSGATEDYAAYEVTPAEGTADDGSGCTVTIASDDESAQILLYNTSGPADENTLADAFTALNFTFDPIPPAGANADTLTTVYFETPYAMKHDGEYVLSESSDTYYANWTYAGGSDAASTNHYDGSMTMLLTETGWAEVDYEFDSGTSDCFSAELDTIGEQVSWDITFHNEDWSWSDTFEVNVMYMGEA